MHDNETRTLNLQHVMIFNMHGTKCRLKEESYILFILDATPRKREDLSLQSKVAIATSTMPKVQVR